MALTKLVGFKHAEGNCTIDGKNIDYNNVNLFYITNSDTSVTGFTAQTQKIKVKDFQMITGLAQINELTTWLDKEIEFDWSQIGSRVVLSQISLKGVK